VSHFVTISLYGDTYEKVLSGSSHGRVFAHFEAT
jgi:hypothetical protein